jgi:Skp family chaperone for outer membrane proteins
MRKLKATLRLVLIVIWSIVVTSDSFGSDPATNRGTSVAVVDMAKLLRNHPIVKDASAELQKQRREHEANVDRQRRELDAQFEELDAIESDSPEHTLRRRQIQDALAELESSDERSQVAFAERSAQAHYKAYREVQERVKQFALQHRIDLVLNYDSSDADPEDPEEIMRRLQDRVVYQSRLDITELVHDIVTGRLDGSRDLVHPRPVKQYPPGTKVMYTECIPRSIHPPNKYVLPRKAADRVVAIANRIKPHSKPTRLAPYTCAPVGSFAVGNSCLHLLREGVLVDPAFQAAIDPVLKKLVEIQKENDWKMDDQVFQAWIRELEKTTAAQKQEDQSVDQTLTLHGAVLANSVQSISCGSTPSFTAVSAASAIDCYVMATLGVPVRSPPTEFVADRPNAHRGTPGRRDSAATSRPRHRNRLRRPDRTPDRSSAMPAVSIQCTSRSTASACKGTSRFLAPFPTTRQAKHIARWRCG